ncbi:erv26 superfamily protein [Sorochytrium milnesiophthora]
MILLLISYLGMLMGIAFFTLSLACGLYYLAELVEEYTTMTRKVITSLTALVMVLHVLLFAVDRLSLWRILFSMFCHAVYSINLRTFPFISFTDPSFLASCVLAVVNHYVWFRYFQTLAHDPFTRRVYPFSHIAAFFALCLWLVPFAYFVSLSANDSTLPVTGSGSQLDINTGGAGSSSSPMSATFPAAAAARLGRGRLNRSGLMKSLLSYVVPKRESAGNERMRKVL